MSVDFLTTTEEITFFQLYGWKLLFAHMVILGTSLSFAGFTANEDYLTAFGKSITSPVFIAIQASFISVSVYATASASGLNRLMLRDGRLAHAASVHVGSDTRKHADTSKTTLLRRTVQRVKYFGRKLAPVKTFARGALSLAAVFATVIYVVFCFGAPLNFPPFASIDPDVGYDELTASFAALLTIHAFLPVLLVYGCDESLVSCYSHVFLKREEHGGGNDSPAASLLFYCGFGAVFGAWVGAFPIPLDWDRPWQAWPIPCSIGCVVGAALSNLVVLALVNLRENFLLPPTLLLRKSKFS